MDIIKASEDAAVADGVATSGFLYLINAFALEAGEIYLGHHRRSGLEPMNHASDTRIKIKASGIETKTKRVLPGT